GLFATGRGNGRHCGWRGVGRHRGHVLCVMLAACQRAGDLRRAADWTSVLLERLAPGGGMPRIVRTECCVAYGALLRSVGRWNEAEIALLDALSPTASHSTVLRFTAAVWRPRWSARGLTGRRAALTRRRTGTHMQAHL